MAKLLPVLIMMFGLAAGIGAGVFLRPDPVDKIEVADKECVMPDDEADSHGAAADGHGDSSGEEPINDCDTPQEETADGHGESVPDDVQYVKLDRQFVVPVLFDSKVTSLVILSLSIEVDPAISDRIYEMEPKLRDELLRAMFKHANSGGFDGQFTGGEAMRDLKGSLLEAAQHVIDGSVYSVLITDILRQDI